MSNSCCGDDTENPGVSEAEARQMVVDHPEKYKGMFATEGGGPYVLLRKANDFSSPCLQGRNPCDEPGIWRACGWVFQTLPPVNLELDPDWPGLHTDKNGGELRGIAPGRGLGLWDDKPICFVHTPHPCDVRQGDIGDCWLMSAIATVAETPGAIAKIFRHTGVDLKTLPRDEHTNLVATLYDVDNDFAAVDVAINETLCCYGDSTNKSGSYMSEGNEMWACYLEKAYVAFAGGWKNVWGGNSHEAWKRLVGCRQSVCIVKNGEGQWLCACGDEYPEGGNSGLNIDELFQRMCEWSKENYLLGAGTVPGDDHDEYADGIVRGHAYSILACLEFTANNGDKLDLVQLRNPWGGSEYQCGRFDDDGPGWDDYPELKEAVKFHVADDGVFWMTKEELFQFYNCIYCGAANMKEWVKVDGILEK